MNHSKQTIQMRGHLVYWRGGWRYLDNDALVLEEGDRPCVECGEMPTPEGYDACIGHLPDRVTWACCGHGVEEGYIRWGNDFDHKTDALIVNEVSNPNTWTDTPPNTVRVARTFYVHPRKHSFYIPIPKCGSNSLRETFPDWHPAQYQEGMKGFALVRNPIERWFSGIKEFLNNNPNPFSQEYLDRHMNPGVPEADAWEYMMELARGGQFEWDDHTKPQLHFVRGYELDLVKLEHGADYIRRHFSRDLAWARSRSWLAEYDLFPAIKEYYAEDWDLYESAK